MSDTSPRIAPLSGWRRIVGTGRRPGTAPQDSLRRHPTATHNTESPHDFFAVVTAGQCEPAANAQPFVDRRECRLIHVNAAECSRGGQLRRCGTTKIESDREDEQGEYGNDAPFHVSASLCRSGKETAATVSRPSSVPRT